MAASVLTMFGCRCSKEGKMSVPVILPCSQSVLVGRVDPVSLILRLSLDMYEPVSFEFSMISTVKLCSSDTSFNDLNRDMVLGLQESLRFCSDSITEVPMVG